MPVGPTPDFSDDTVSVSPVEDKPRAFIVERSGQLGSPVALAEAIAEVSRGNVVLVKDAVRTCGLWDDVRRRTHEAVSDIVSPSTAEKLEERGVEKIHDIADGKQIFEIEGAVTGKLEPKVHGIIRQFLRDGLGYSGNFFSCGKLWVRFMLPQDVAAGHKSLFASRMGHLKPQNPHRDSYYTNPTNGIAIWMAIGRVSRGNGMLVYPDVGLRPVANPGFLQNGFKVHPSETLGKPMNFALDPGDALLFDIEQFHSSEVNVTNDTRHVITAKFTLEPPIYPAGDRWLMHRNDRLMGTPFAFAASIQSRLTTAFLRNVFRRRLLYRLKLLRLRLFGVPVTPSMPPPRITDPDDKPTVKDGRIDLSTLSEGDIRAVSKTYCVARTERGVYAVPRHCTHEGADLAQGYIDGTRIRCVWHNLPFDLQSGKPPCGSLGTLNVRALSEVSPGQFAWPDELESR